MACKLRNVNSGYILGISGCSRLWSLRDSFFFSWIDLPFRPLEPFDIIARYHNHELKKHSLISYYSSSRSSSNLCCVTVVSCGT